MAVDALLAKMLRKVFSEEEILDQSLHLEGKRR